MKFLLIAGFLLPAWAAGVQVVFDPSRTDTGPYPTDALTVADSSQRTGRRMNLPLPDCGQRRAFCEDIALVNRTDGYDLTPRLRVRFSAAPDVETLRAGIFLVPVDNTATRIPINEIILDAETNTMYARPDRILEQSRRYAVIVTDAVRDRGKDPLTPDPSFTSCVQSGTSEYCWDLARAVSAVRGERVIGASVFTTLSVTYWMERAYDAVQGAPTAFRPAGVFPVSEIESIHYKRQATQASDFVNTPLQTALVAEAGRIAFGTYSTPFWAEQRFTDPIPASGATVTLPHSSRDVTFIAFLPAATPPAGGYPVAIFGHGLAQNLLFPGAAVVNSLTRRGYAVIAINAFGHGGGPESRIVFQMRGGSSMDSPRLGRIMDLDGNGRFETLGFPFEGCPLVGVPGTVSTRICFEQTILDVVQLARTVREGVDLDGDGRADLATTGITYVGHSMGTFVGAVLMALDPNVSLSVLNSPGGAILDVFSQSPAFQQLLAPVIGFRAPYLLNAGPRFDTGMVLRDQPVKINRTPGAIDLQNFLELGSWASAHVEPINWGCHLKESRLQAVPRKAMLFQVPRGEPEIPNQISSRLIRAANLRTSTSFYRGDLAIALAPGQIVPDTHGFLYTYDSPQTAAIAIAAQEQLAAFIAAGDDTIPDVNPLIESIFGRRLFEVLEVLPEDPGFPMN